MISVVRGAVFTTVVFLCGVLAVDYHWWAGLLALFCTLVITGLS